MIARLAEAYDIGDDVRHFVFDAEDGAFSFTPGQWVPVTETVGGKHITRPYSIASAPAGQRFELCLNRVREGKVSPLLFALSPGDTVHIGQPNGTFVLREPAWDTVMVATGTGIAPFRSMLAARMDHFAAHRVTLLLGARYERNLLYRGEFEELARRRPNFRFLPVLSRPEGGWAARAGYVQQHIAEAIENRVDVDVYICGLRAMVNDVRADLAGRGFDRKRILYEKYD